MRNRVEDLGVLIAGLVARYAPDGPPRTLSRAAARALFLHPWPFNVRELEQALRTAIAVGSGPEIKLAELRLEAPIAVPQVADEVSTIRDRLIALLDQHDGNVSAVAGRSRPRVLRSTGCSPATRSIRPRASGADAGPTDA